MSTAGNIINEWEKLEVERSSNEARKRSAADLTISQKIIQRYLRPPENTPFPLEYAYFLLGDVHGKTVLDYGCGAGENCVLISSHGGKPIGVDISADLLELAKKRMALHGNAEHEFKLGSAHRLPLDNESIDIVFGIAILHHLDLSMASDEVFRVLKKGGRAIFLEPVRNSKIISFARKLIPYRQADLSPFERPLTDAELHDFAAPFSSYKGSSFSLPFVNLIETLGLSDRLLHFSIRMDGKLLRSLPFLSHYATIKVFELEK